MLKPKTAPADDFSYGITTRVLAKRLEERRLSQQGSTPSSRRNSVQQSSSRRASVSSNGNDTSRGSRRSSLVGTTLPNSTLLRNIQIPELDEHTTDIDAKAKEKEAFIEQLIEKLKSEEQAKIANAPVPLVWDEEADRKLYERIQIELAKLNRMEELKNLKRPVKQPDYILNEDAEQQEQRSTRRTSIVAQTLSSPRPTLDDIKNAIGRSQTTENLVNVKVLEENVQSTPFKISPTISSDSTFNLVKEIPKNTKRNSAQKSGLKKLSPKVSPTKSLRSRSRSNSSTSLSVGGRRKSILKQVSKVTSSHTSKRSKKRVSIADSNEALQQFISKQKNKEAEKSPEKALQIQHHRIRQKTSNTSNR